MVFDWNDANIDHIARHNVTPSEAEQALLNDPIDIEEQDDEFDGTRYLQIGETDRGRILIVLSTVREDAIRVGSAWDAPQGHKKLYFRRKLEQSWRPQD